jgi:ABC-2 type transport system ATP-binding protein
MSELALNLTGIHKSFRSKPVLRGVDLSVPAGTITGLMGKNGAGKTTMIKCLLGLLKSDAGVPTVFGDPSWNIGAENRQRIGYVPQTLTGFRWMKAKTMLEYTGSFYLVWNKQKAASLLAEWDVNPDARISQLSEGEQQKLSIIQALCHEPDLLVFDEPVAALDPQARRTFIKHLIDLNMDEKRTMLFSTHIASDLERVAGDIAILKDGVIAYKGDLSTLQDRVRRLHIQSSRELPDPIPIPVPNVIRSVVDHTNATVTVDSVGDDVIRSLQNTLSARISVEHLNLEEIFLEVNQ